MKKSIGQASGKLILSGEYAVVFGYPGIAVPCSCLGYTAGAVPAQFGVTATWGSPSPLPLSPTFAKATAGRRGEREITHHETTIRHCGIENGEYLHHILDAITTKTGPLHGHLTIENHIPIGRGMGSSTALVIAIARAICGATTPESSLRKFTLSIEDTVNPGHSGIDFTVIWNEKPILFRKGKPPQILDSTINRLMGTFASSVLIDTGKPNETTAELVGWMQSRSDDSGIVAAGLQKIGQCTSRLLAGESPFTVFPDHHRAQVAIGVVPTPTQDLIADVENVGGAAKVVGAGERTGGGGIVLALHLHPEKLLAVAKRHGMAILALTPSHHPPTLTPLTS